MELAILSFPINHQHYTIKKNISFFEIPFHQKKHDVIKKIGKERHQILLDANGVKVEILFYKMTFYGFHSVVQFHFVDNKFVFGAVSIKDKNTTVANFLSSLLSSKYYYHFSEADLENICLTDSKDHKILYRCLFRPTLIYMSETLENIIAKTKHSVSMFQEHSDY